MTPPSWKGKDKERFYPYSEGWKKNLKRALFGKLPPSLVNPVYSNSSISSIILSVCS